MSYISKFNCHTIRVVIERANHGPEWYREELTSPLLEAIRAELRNQTREWVRKVIIAELKAVMPAHERNQRQPD